MSNFGLELVLQELYILFVWVKVGDCYVMVELLVWNWMLGGENLGYIVCCQNIMMGDVIIVVLQVLMVFKYCGQILVEVCQGICKCFQVLINVCFKGESDLFEYLLVKEVSVCVIE